MLVESVRRISRAHVLPLLSTVLGLSCGENAATLSGSVRTDELLSADWRFLREDVTGAELPELDDASWQAASIPHTWNALDGQDGGDDFYRGAGWYRRRFTVPAVSSPRPTSGTANVIEARALGPADEVVTDTITWVRE